MSVCLCMIVRDEAAIIQRCLESCRQVIDTWVIIDTGSTDGTQDIIGGFMLDADIPGELIERPWVDFGTNRSELMEAARGKADWLLLLDADHTIEHADMAYVHTLNGADSYMLKHDGDLTYWIKRLVRGDRKWWYVGSTHEYITTDPEPPEVQERTDALVIKEHYDGGRRAEKFERDLKLLMADDQDEPRVVFYLANTLRDLGHTKKAIAQYRRRAEMGGWQEEVFYSLLEAGRLGDDVKGLFEAWSYRPTRAEPLYELAWRFRRDKLWSAAFLVAERGLGVPLSADTLFVHRWMYDWGLEFEYSIAAWWAGYPDLAAESNERLLANPALPDNYRTQVEENGVYSPSP